MPIRNTIKKGEAPPSDARAPTGSYSLQMARPTAYQPIRPTVAAAPLFSQDGIPIISTRDLGYFFGLAASLYDQGGDADGPGRLSQGSSSSSSNGGGTWDWSGLTSQPAAPATEAPPAYGAGPRPHGTGELDAAAILVLWLFRQTRTDILPVAERFHLGAADRQPLYSLTAQPSIRSATEFNELAIARRDPVGGAWHAACTADIEPALELVKPGRWTVATLVLDAMPAWKKVVSGRVVQQTVDSVGHRGSKLSLAWGDRATLGRLGEAYGLWWSDGSEQGAAEAFYVTEGWRGFGTQGVVRVKPAVRDTSGAYQDPRNCPADLAVVYFFADPRTPPKFVCSRVEAQVRLDVLMAGLMVVMVVETRKAAVVKEYGSLPAYDSAAHWRSPLVERGPDYNEAYMD